MQWEVAGRDWQAAAEQACPASLPAAVMAQAMDRCQAAHFRLLHRCLTRQPVVATACDPKQFSF